MGHSCAGIGRLSVAIVIVAGRVMNNDSPTGFRDRQASVDGRYPNPGRVKYKHIRIVTL
jgi:hypothetical protein